MAVTSLLLVLAEHRQHAAVRPAAIWYAAMTQAGFVALLIGLAVAGRGQPALTSPASAPMPRALSPAVKGACSCCACSGSPPRPARCRCIRGFLAPMPRHRATCRR